MSSLHDEADKILAAVAAKNPAMAALFRSDFKRWIDGGGDLDAALKGLRQGGRELGVQIQFNAPPAPVVTAQKDTAPQRAPAATEARARAKKLWQRSTALRTLPSPCSFWPRLGVCSRKPAAWARCRVGLLL